MSLAISAITATVMLLAAIVPPIGGDERPTDRPQYPAPPGYLLPWPGGELQDVTQGEETPLTHNGAAAYAFDFGLNYETVVAARGGRVTMVREDSNSGGCDPRFSASANYVVIDHGDGTSGLYLHLAYHSIEVEPGQVIARGEPIAISGETGVTCGAGDTGPGAHLHFQVQITQDGAYSTQSVPITFDDVAGRSGIPAEGETLVSGNYGPGKPQKIKLTPRRVPRVFNPTARPVDPRLAEAPLPPDVPLPSPDALAALPVDTALPADTPTENPTETSTRTATNTPRPTGTPVPPSATASPAPSDTPSPAPSDTPTPAPSDTPSPAPSDTRSPAPSDTPTPEPGDTPSAP